MTSKLITSFEKESDSEQKQVYVPVAGLSKEIASASYLFSSSPAAELHSAEVLNWASFDIFKLRPPCLS